LQEVLESAGMNCLVYDEIPSENPSEHLQEAVQLAKAGKVQVIVALGGVRVSMAARVVSLAAASSCSISAMASEELPPKKALPCIEIPTSFRNPLLFAAKTYLGEPSTRIPLWFDLPTDFLRCVLVDPVLTQTLPAKYGAALLMDAVLCGLEGYISEGAGCLGRPLLRDGISACSDAVLGVYNAPEEIRPRQKACEGGLLVSLGLAFGRQGIGGALVYVMSSLYGVPKSWLASVLSPHIAEYWIPIVPQRMAEVAGAMGVDIASLSATEAARQVPQVLRRMIGQLEAPGRLRDLDISLAQVMDAVEIVMEMDMIRSAPRFPQESEIVEIIKRAF
ncbi:MAG: iron-containing alcohol dehydrogenase, partial [Spirochaetaceae bacterium]